MERMIDFAKKYEKSILGVTDEGSKRVRWLGNPDLFIYPRDVKTWYNLRDEDNRRGIVLRSDIV